MDQAQGESDAGTGSNSAAAGGFPPAWTPSDFTLSGRFCSIEEIRREFEKARQKAGAAGALLLAADESAALGTLSMATPGDDPDFDRLGALLARGDLLRTGTWARELLNDRRASVPELVRTTIPARRRRRPRFPSTARNLMRVLAEIAKRNEMEELADWLKRDLDKWVPADIPLAARGARVSTAVLFYDVRGPTTRVDGNRVVRLDEAVLRLTECVNGTVQADVRRDDVIMRRLDSKLSPPLRRRRVDFAATAEALLELAADASGSDAGACYLLDPASGNMTCEAVYMPQHLRRDWKFEEELPAKKAVAPVCAEEGLAIQVPPGLLAAPDLLHSCRHKSDLETAVLELATPMPGPLSSPGAPAIGAVVIVKLSAQPEPFRAYEVALARNAALRLALINATTKSERAARTFTSLSRNASRLRSNSLATDLIKRAQRQVTAEPDGCSRTLPDDLAVVLPVIQKVLKTLGEVTQSETVTFRAALPDPHATGTHGVTLARIASNPTTLMDDEFKEQPDDGRGVNWKVAREGSLDYCSDIALTPQDEAGIYVQHHEKTRSELCVPVFVEDRVVGVVNLESPMPHAYDSQIDIAQALAEHIGTAIANARLVLSGVLQVQASDILRKSHDLSHAHEPLEAIAKQLPSGAALEVRAEADQIQQQAAALLTFTVDPEDEAVRTQSRRFPDLVDIARRKSKVDFDTVVDCGGDWLGHAPEVAGLIVKSLTDILDNARRNRDPEEPEVRIELDHGRWGGEDQDLMVVRIKTKGRMLSARAINAYRCPLSNFEVIYDDYGEPIKLIDEPLLGAYLAGTHARRAGGEVHLAYIGTGESRVVFSVPSPRKENDVPSND